MPGVHWPPPVLLGQADERHCLKKQGRQSLRNDTKGYCLGSSCTDICMYVYLPPIHTHHHTHMLMCTHKVQHKPNCYLNSRQTKGIERIEVELLYQGSSKGYSCSTDKTGSSLNRKTHGPSQPENKSATHHSISLAEVESKILLRKTPYPSNRTQRIQVGSDPKA